jgi:hypothetical protein
VAERLGDALAPQSDPPLETIVKLERVVPTLATMVRSLTA